MTEVESSARSSDVDMKLLLVGEDSMDIGYYVDFHERSWPEVKTAMTTEKVLARKTEGIRSKYGPYHVLPAGRKGYPWHIQYPGYHVYFQDTRIPKLTCPKCLDLRQFRIPLASFVSRARCRTDVSDRKF